MNRYPVWKWAILVIVLLVGALYSLPNFFGETPAVQVSAVKSTVKIDDAVAQRVEQALAAASLTAERVAVEGTSVRARFDTLENQLKAKDVIQKALVPDRTTLASSSRSTRFRAPPPGSVPSMPAPCSWGWTCAAACTSCCRWTCRRPSPRRPRPIPGDIRTALRDKNVRHSGISRDGQTIDIKVARRSHPEHGAQPHCRPVCRLAGGEPARWRRPALRASIKPEAARKVQEQALKQNIVTLHNRINELGVAEPVIQQQGLDRIVVQLPGVQDTAKAKDILGRTATLEVRMVDESTEGARRRARPWPRALWLRALPERSGQSVIVKKQVILTGENLTDAQPGFDSQTQEPTVNLTLDAKGSRIFRDITRENIGKRMAIVLFEKGKGEVVTAPVIRSEIGGGRVQISGRMTTAEANDTALLLRAGSLAAPMEIIEEYTIGPSLGADNIERGIHSVVWGLAAIAAFMCVYYQLFGVISSIALAVNVMLLVAILSMLQATLTLPGIAAMALAIGVAIDSNVLINERMREELRAGVAPQAAIHTGYDRAWATILDSNVTTLIAGLALLAFGSGPVRGFAVVHCIGI
jgi:preprotein translocase subunit SecD